jgi:hypothetical protein
MWRKLSTLGAALSLLLCVTLLGAWLVSLRATVAFDFAARETLWRVSVAEGRLRVDDTPQRELELRRLLSAFNEQDRLDKAAHESLIINDGAIDAAAFAAADRQRETLIARNRVRDDIDRMLTRAGAVRPGARSASMLVVILATAFAPGWWFVAWMWRRSKRRAPGACAHCGYDLRGTPDRCPECGAVPREPPHNPPMQRTATASSGAVE